MTGSHEVRGSIPLGSTNNINSLAPLLTRPFASNDELLKPISLFHSNFAPSNRRPLRFWAPDGRKSFSHMRR